MVGKERLRLFSSDPFFLLQRPKIPDGARHGGNIRQLRSSVGAWLLQLSQAHSRSTCTSMFCVRFQMCVYKLHTFTQREARGTEDSFCYCYCPDYGSVTRFRQTFSTCSLFRELLRSVTKYFGPKVTFSITILH
jgi:hypothetical protein